MDGAILIEGGLWRCRRRNGGVSRNRIGVPILVAGLCSRLPCYGAWRGRCHCVLWGLSGVLWWEQWVGEDLGMTAVAIVIVWMSLGRWPHCRRVVVLGDPFLQVDLLLLK